MTGGAPASDQPNPNPSDPAIARTGKLTSFLTKAINELTSKPQGTEPMANTPLPPNTPSEPIRKNITGASFLGTEFKQNLAAVRAKVAAARTKLNGAVADLSSAADSSDGVADAIQAEAADLRASLGQASNDV